STKYAKYYPSALSTTQMNAVQSTCAAGYLYNFSGTGQQDANGYYIDDGSQTTEQIPYNYNYLGGDTLSSTVKLYSQEAAGKNSAGGSKAVRGNATPITYALSITQDGLLSLSYSVNGGTAQPVITNQSITASNGPLPASF
ncbi:pilus assembly protein PilY, partial [Corallococcus llansteffanensis]